MSTSMEAGHLQPAATVRATVKRRPLAVRIRWLAVRAGMYLLVLLVGVLFLFPWIWLVSTSLKAPAQILQVPPRILPNPVMWKNYYYAVTNIRYGHYLVNTLVICAAVVLGRVLSCTVVAYSISHVQWRPRNWIFIAILGTMMLPGQVTMIPIFIIFTRLKWVNTFYPLIVPAFFGDAFFIFLLRQFFMGIPRELTEAAQLDGCSHFGIYRRIVMPLAKPALATVIAFTFIWTYTDFQTPLIYLKDQNLWTLSLGLQGYLRRYGGGGGTALGALMAASTLYTLPMIVLFFAAQRTLVQGIVTTGFK